MNVNYFHAEPGVIFFSSKHCRSRSASSLPDQDPLFSFLLVNTCSLITDKNLVEILCIVYKIIQSIIS